MPPHADLRLYGAAAFERCLQVSLQTTCMQSRACIALLLH